jgi:putative membrane protein
MFLIVRFLITAFAVLLAAQLVPGFVVADFYTALIVAVLLGVIGVTVKPVLMVLTLPITLITFGLFSLVINAGILLFLASFVSGFHFTGNPLEQFVAALVAGVIIAAIQWVAHRVT